MVIPPDFKVQRLKPSAIHHYLRTVIVGGTNCGKTGCGYYVVRNMIANGRAQGIKFESAYVLNGSEHNNGNWGGDEKGETVRMLPNPKGGEPIRHVVSRGAVVPKMCIREVFSEADLVGVITEQKTVYDSSRKKPWMMFAADDIYSSTRGQKVQKDNPKTSRILVDIATRGRHYGVASVQLIHSLKGEISDDVLQNQTQLLLISSQYSPASDVQNLFKGILKPAEFAMIWDQVQSVPFSFLAYRREMSSIGEKFTICCAPNVVSPGYKLPHLCTGLWYLEKLMRKPESQAERTGIADLIQVRVADRWGEGEVEDEEECYV